MSFHHSSVIPSIKFHVDNILSFGCHSIHSMVIRALEWRGMTFCRNDRNEVRMTVSVILRAFLSFLSSQISGKNVVFLDFIPIIPSHSCHSGVIRKFWFNVNCHGMMSNEGMKATTFPYATQSFYFEILLYFMVIRKRWNCWQTCWLLMNNAGRCKTHYG